MGATKRAEANLDNAITAAKGNQCVGCNGTGLSKVGKCGHTNQTEDYTPYKYSTKRIRQRTKTADIFAIGVTLLEMLCGKITVPHKDKQGNLDKENKQACGWKLVVADNVWKAQWTVGLIKERKAA